MAKKFFITTPIYYASGLPHIGNAYASIIADVYARYKRMFGYQVKFSTGLDENGQKMVEKAKSTGKDIRTFLQDIETWSKQIRQALDISYTDFIRTTQKSHQQFVQSVLQKVHNQDQDKPTDQKDFYKWKYEGLYCTACEAFKKERDLIEKDGQNVCPDHLTTPEKISEENRFFHLSAYQNFLTEFYQQNPNFIVPTHRFKEIQTFVAQWLEDFSISRENNDFGIPLPFDPQQVTYIWYDALLNYLTVCQEQDQDFRDPDTQIVHVLAKDIAKFHAIYRPAMLQSADFRLPNQEIITGYFTVDGHKMSKTIGNIIDPHQLVQDFHRDHILFYLFYDVAIGSDWDFSRTRFREMYDSMLIGGRWNLINRVTKLWQKYQITQATFNNSKLKTIKAKLPAENQLISFFETDFDTNKFEKTYLDHAKLKDLLHHRYQIIQSANDYIQTQEPRKKYKDETTKQTALDDISFLLRLIKNLSLVIAPLTIKGFTTIQAIFNNNELNKITTNHVIPAQAGTNQFHTAFNLQQFTIQLNPQIVYPKNPNTETK